ncbi:MAG: dihydroorotate dehydrogenase, partial [Chloroflexi bacterium]|nr:dihydroorotate dehydrogenase [Chloroflexota bacterium]
IASAGDAIEFIMAGASAVQVGTATFADPQSMLSIIEGMARFMEQNGFSSLKDMIGIANVR